MCSIPPIICACQRFELEMHQAQIGQFCSVLPEDNAIFWSLARALALAADPTG
jgi:hypothetical protein